MHACRRKLQNQHDALLNLASVHNLSEKGRPQKGQEGGRKATGRGKPGRQAAAAERRASKARKERQARAGTGARAAKESQADRETHCKVQLSKSIN